MANTNLTRRWGGSSSTCDKSIGGISERNNGKITNCFTYNCKFKNGNSTTKGAIISSGNEHPMLSGGTVYNNNGTISNCP